MNTPYDDMDKLTPEAKAKEIEENKKKEDLKSFMYRNAKSGSIYNVEKVLEDAGETFLNKNVSKPFKTLKIQAEERAKEQHDLFPTVNASLLNEKINEMIVNINECCKTKIGDILLMDGSYDDVVADNLRVLISENVAIDRQKLMEKEAKKTERKSKKSKKSHADGNLRDGLVGPHKELGVVEETPDTLDVNKFIWELLIVDNNNDFYAGVVDLINVSSANKGLSNHISTINHLIALINYPDQDSRLFPPQHRFTHINTLQLLFGYILKKDGKIVNQFANTHNKKYDDFKKNYRGGFLKLLKKLEKDYHLEKSSYEQFLAALKSEEFIKAVSDEQIEVFNIISKYKGQKKKMTKKKKHKKKKKKKKKTKMR